MVVATILGSWALPFTAKAQEKLRYSCSAQVFEAFEKERLETFTKATGIEVDFVCDLFSCRGESPYERRERHCQYG